MKLDEVVDELYGLAPDRFVEARNARARELRGAGDRQAAEEVRKLSRPSAAAWAANLVVRTEPAAVEELLQVGEQLRRAQRGARGDDIRSLSARRRELVQRLVAAGSAHARAAGHPLGPAAGRQLEGTFEAAVADEAAAQALGAGRLEDALSHVGFGDVDTTGPATRPAARGGSTAATDARRARAAVQAANAAVGEARRRERDAEAEHRVAARSLVEAQRRLDKAAHALARAQQARARAQETLEAARAAVTASR